MTVHQTAELLAHVRAPISAEKLEALVQDLQDNIAAAALYSEAGDTSDLLKKIAELSARVDVLEARLDAAAGASTIKGLVKALQAPVEDV